VARDLKFTLQIDLEGNEAAVRGLDGTRVAVGRVGEETEQTAAAQRRGADAARQQESAFGGLSQQARVLGGALAALGVARLGRQLFEVNAQAQSSQAALRTLTGSVSEAAIVWERLLDFASTTPFALEQSIDAFRDLKSVGLDPGIAALRTYADIAAAAGAQLTQVTAAVSRAATGQMDSLRQFGIVARQQGDEIEFTFNGVTTVVERNAQAVEQFLQQLGRENFAGAAAEQMETLSGQASNLGDSVTRLAFAFGEAGANDLFASMLSTLSSAVEGVTDNVEGLVPIITIVAAALGTRLFTAAAGAAAQMLSTASAAGILRGALALLGGPAGAVALAVGALIGYIATLERTAERTERLRGTTDRITRSLEDMSRTRAQATLIDLQAQIQDTTDALVRQARTIETLSREANRPGLGENQRQRLREDIVKLRAEEEDLQRVLRDQFQLRQDLQAVVAGTYQAQQDATDGATGAVIELADETENATAAVVDYGAQAAAAFAAAAAEAERNRQELQRIVDAANPLAAQQRALVAQIATVDQALRRETGSTRELERAKESLERRLTALRSPMLAVTEAHEANIEALEAELRAIRAGEEVYGAFLSQRRAEVAAQEQINALLAEGHELRQQDKDAILEQAQAEERLRGEIEREKQAREEANRAWDAFLTEIVGAFISTAGTIGDVWSDLGRRIQREVINLGVGSALGLSTASTPIISGAGQLLGLGSSAGGGTLSALFSGGSLFPGLESSITNTLTQLELSGGAVGAVATELANATANIALLPGGLVGGGLITAGAGLAGGQLGQAVFGQAGTVSQLGGLGGGLAGAAFGPAALGAFGGPVGALAGSFIGSAIDSVFGGGKERRAAVFAGPEGVQRAEVKHTIVNEAGLSGLQFAGEAQRVGEEGQKAVAAMTEQFVAIDNVLTQLTRGAGFDVDLSDTDAFGRGMFKVGPDAATDFVRQWIAAVSEPFDAELKAAAGALVGDTAEDLINAYQGLLTIRDDLQRGGTLFGGLGSLSQISAAISPEEIQRVAQFGAQIKSLTDTMRTDSIALWEQSQRSVFDLWRDQGDAIARAAEVAATEQDFALLQAAVVERYQTEADLIAQIMGALEASAARFSATYERIFVDGLKTEEDRYNYFRDQADALAETITTLNDPGEISAAAERYNRLLNEAYQQLGEGSRDIMRDEILSTIDEMQTLVDERLQASLGMVQADGDPETPGSVANTIQAATERSLADIRQAMSEAIDAVSQQQAETSRQSTALVNSLNLWAANLPENIRVQITGTEVAF